MRLKKKQKEFLLALVAEGLQSDEINARAAKFKPPFEVSRQQVDFYRDSRGVALEEIKAESESGALKQGFALKERRIEVMSEIAERIYADLQKGIREGEAFEFKEAEVKQLRGLFADIAKETAKGDDEPNREVKVTIAYEHPVKHDDGDA